MKKTLILFGALCSTIFAEPTSTESKWVQLFNGKDLTGWIPKVNKHELGVNFADTWRVEDGLLKVRYDKYEKFDEQYGHLFYEKPFSHYRLRIEYRFIGDQVEGGPKWAIRNNGVMFHCQDPKTMDVIQKFPVSVEFQLLGGSGKNKRSTANLCTPGTNIVKDSELVRKHVIPSSSKTYYGDAWVTAEYEVHGSGSVKHIMEGETVLEYKNIQYDPSNEHAKKLIKDKNLLIEGGYISIQAESAPIDIRKVEVLELPKE